MDGEEVKQLNPDQDVSGQLPGSDPMSTDEEYRMEKKVRNLCQWCGDPLGDGTPTKGDMHLDCFKEAKAEHDHDQLRDDRLTGDDQ